eukprot:TRINITY_DN66161_c0_g1_i1.p1 TRINITY_DN66161_c0_g1~~TRINITY_DN66161_c0_g1_i1.p1  ORF type:complete len:375 (+),score=38.84 TRINITY_DN66161_c0_g1_i1:83-1207(+)
MLSLQEDDIEWHAHDAETRFLGTSDVLRGRFRSTDDLVCAHRVDCADKEFMRTVLQNAQSWPKCPELVPYFGICTIRGMPWTIAELMNVGNVRSLSSKAPDESIPHEHLGRISAAVMRGLGFLHERGVVHADLRPEHILINTLGEVKVAGYAYRDDPTSVVQRCIGQIYMSPEHCMGEEIDGRANVWSYGVVLYELVCKRHPFVGKSIVEVFHKLIERPEPRLPAEEFPDALCDFVAQCLIRQGSSCNETRSIQLSVATPEVSHPLVVIVNDVAGNEVFGPAYLQGPLCVRDLKKTILEQRGTTCVKFSLVLDDRLLQMEDMLIGDDRNARFELVLVADLSRRATAFELIHHAFCTIEASTPGCFAKWLKQLTA